jgi:hypothetical protein
LLRFRKSRRGRIEGERKSNNMKGKKKRVNLQIETKNIEI